MLDLSGNGISDDGIETLCSTSHQSMPNLKVLNLSWNRISCRGATALGDALANSKNKWTSLDLSGVTVTRGGGHDAGLGVNKTNRQSIGDDGLKAIAQGLENNITLEKLLLNRHDEDITHEGIEALAQALRHHPLQHLELNRTRVDDQSMLALAEVLHETSLRHLDVTINTVTIVSIRVLARSLVVHNPPLQTLLLTNNNMDLQALQCLEEAARYNTNLLTLEVYGHSAGREQGSQVVWRIRPWLRQNRTQQGLLKEHQLGLTPYFLAAVGRHPDCTRLFRFVREQPNLFRKL
jgi:Ran GTPase-activating protein (RanGAP) involved in mRNA processing and transport